MKKLLVYMDEDFHEDLKELAHRKKTSMSELVRYALDATFEDELDVIAGARSLDEYLRNPSSAISLDDFLKEHGIVLPDRANAADKKRDESPAPKRKGALGRSLTRAR